MTRRPSPRAVRLFASALGTVTLLTTAACMNDGDGGAADTAERRQARSTASPTTPAAPRPSASPSTPSAPAAGNCTSTRPFS